MAWLSRKAKDTDIREAFEMAEQKAKSGKPLKADPALAPHGNVAKADPYSFQVSHRRLAWGYRTSVATNLMQGLVIVSMVNLFAVLLAKWEPQLGLLHVNPKDDRIYRVEPISQDVEGFALLLEAKARRFVRNLLEIDVVTQTERFREAFRMMDKTFFDRFEEERINSGKVQDALDSGLTRTITVESVDRIEAFGGTYKYAVDFVQTDTRAGEVVEVLKLRAYLNMTTRPNQVHEIDKYENPLGITVLDLVLKERGNS